MKRFFLKVAAVFVIICGIEIQSASAATDADALFVPVGEAMIKGLTGIAAVVMMGVGTWLHGKSNIAKWNAFVKQSMGKAAASGSILSFAFISFLSVFRESAETIIFYAGMAPDMSAGALAAGIALAFLIVSAVGLIVIKYSVRVPMRLFFIGAALLIYILAFKILGKSIHSLQVTESSILIQLQLCRLLM